MIKKISTIIFLPDYKYVILSFKLRDKFLWIFISFRALVKVISGIQMKP
jgi:hypothetical protein